MEAAKQTTSHAEVSFVNSLTCMICVPNHRVEAFPNSCQVLQLSICFKRNKLMLSIMDDENTRRSKMSILPPLRAQEGQTGPAGQQCSMQP
eukprot:scaffold132509_cov21-Tisochrysis_lutea.AAC.1